jgi:hypothetical protein
LTRQRNDNHSTEFALWLRGQLFNQNIDEIKCIDSAQGFINTNIDYLWENYNTGDWMLIEEKRFMSQCRFSQAEQFKNFSQKLRNAVKKDYDGFSKYHGFHLIQFENTSPDDGKIYLDHKEISKLELIDFLQFKKILKNKAPA